MSSENHYDSSIILCSDGDDHKVIHNTFFTLICVMPIGLCIIFGFVLLIMSTTETRKYTTLVAESTNHINALKIANNTNNQTIKDQEKELVKYRYLYGDTVFIPKTVVLGPSDMNLFLDQKAGTRGQWQELLDRVTTELGLQGWLTRSSEDVNTEKLSKYDHLKVMLLMVGSTK